MLTDVKKRRLLEVALGKNTKSLMEQLAHIPGRDKVKIVADKFHVLRLPSPMIMKVGRQIHGHRQ